MGSSCSAHNKTNLIEYTKSDTKTNLVLGEAIPGINISKPGKSTDT